MRADAPGGGVPAAMTWRSVLDAVVQGIEPPTDPDSVNSVLAWIAMLLVAALAAMYWQGKRGDDARHADKDRVVARMEKTVDDQVAAMKETATALREQTVATKELSTAVREQAAELARLQEAFRQLEARRGARS